MSVLGYHNDNASTGQNLSEISLTPANVNASTFGKRYSTAVDGDVYAQPLYVPQVNITTGREPGIHNVLYVATEHDTLYAIDANNGVVLWHDSFIDPAAGVTTISSDDVGIDITPEVGITGTPVIDPTTGILYLDANTKEVRNGASHYVHRLHAINIQDGSEALGGPALIADTIFDGTNFAYVAGPTIHGTGDGNVNGNITFNALRQLQRPGLTIANGNVYIAYGSHADAGPYHGWVLGYRTSDLSLAAAFNTTPNGGLGGIWQSGGKLAADSAGNLYFETGNGDFDTTLDANGFPSEGDYGDAIVEVAPDPTSGPSNQNVNGWGLKVVDYFVPHNQQALSNADLDLGSGSPLLLPDSAGSQLHPHLMLGAGKDGTVYLLDRDNMGHFDSTTDRVVQELPGTLHASFDTPAYYNGMVYYVSGYGDVAKSYSLVNGVMSSAPVSQSADLYTFPGSTPSISANGTSDGIVWDLDRGTNQLRAYDASSYANELYTSNQAPAGRDNLGAVVKFSVPTVADGLVFVGTSGAIVTYGLIIPPTQVPNAPDSLVAAAVSSGEIDLTWHPNSTNQDGFAIEESTDGTTFTQIGTAVGTTFSAFGLDASTTYTFQVRAFNSLGFSGYTNRASATTPAGAPSYSLFSSSDKPVHDTDPDTRPTELGVKFRTDVPGLITAIRFYKGSLNIGLHEGHLWTSDDTLLATATFSDESASGWQQVSFDAPVPVQPNTTYVASYHTDTGRYAEDNGYFASSGIDVGPLHALQAGVDGFNGVYLPSPGPAFPTDDFQSANWWVDVVFNPQLTNAPPAAPTNLTATATGAQDIQLHWTRNSTNETAFKIERSFDGVNFTQIDTAPAGSSTYDDTTAAHGTPYTYRIRATNAAGDSGYSNPASATIPIPPTTPSNAQAIFVTTNEIDLVWTDNATNEDGYHVYRRTGASGTLDLIATLPADSQSYKDIGLTADTAYDYHIQAFNVGGFADFAGVSVTTAPAAPALSATPASSTRVNLTWPASPGAVMYDIYRSATSGFVPSTATLIATVSSTSYSDTVSSGTYYYLATAIDSAGQVSLKSNEAPVTVGVPGVGLVAAYSFDEGSGNTLTDISGHGNNGTLSNATWVSGKYGSALQFTGNSNSFVLVNDSASLDLTTGMTLEAWVDPTTLTNDNAGWAGIIAKDHVGSANDVCYALYAANGNDTPPAAHVLVDPTDFKAQGSSSLELGAWAFLAATYDGSTLRVFVNGVEVDNMPVGGSVFTTGDPLRIGGTGSGDMFTGSIDNIRIYNRPLSAPEIQSDMLRPVNLHPPAVTAAVFHYDQAPSTLNFSFSTDVSESVSTSAISIQNLGTGATITATDYLYNAATNTAIFVLPAGLSDGNYRATLLASAVTDGDGRHLDGNADGTPGDNLTYDFFSLTGDVNHDRSVNFSDLLIVAQHYGSHADYAGGDLTHDGVVGFNDLLLLAQHYGNALAATTTPTAAATTLLKSRSLLGQLRPRSHAPRVRATARSSGGIQ